MFSLNFNIFPSSRLTLSNFSHRNLHLKEKAFFKLLALWGNLVSDIYRRGGKYKTPKWPQKAFLGNWHFKIWTNTYNCNEWKFKAYSLTGVSISHFISRTLLLKYSNFQKIYKKLGQFYKKLNFDKKYQIKKNNALLECLLACIPIIRCI